MIALLQDRPLSDKTSYRIGGNAAWYAEPADAEGLQEAVDFAKAKGLELLVLGRGSNVLVSDRGWPGLVINLCAHLNRIDWDHRMVTAQSGVPLDLLVRESIQRGLQGMEELSGIPAAVGGAVVMNAGAYGTSIADTIVETTILDLENGRTEILNKDSLSFGYRSSILQKRRSIVISARFELRPGSMVDLEKIRHEIIEKRKSCQPLDLPSCGSVFKRPPGNFAGALIEQAGLKGLRYGNAQISPKHANFIVNLGGAKAAEVRHLIVLAQKAVYEKSGLLLEPEVVFAGEFEEPLLLIST